MQSFNAVGRVGEVLQRDWKHDRILAPISVFGSLL